MRFKEIVAIYQVMYFRQCLHRLLLNKHYGYPRIIKHQKYINTLFLNDSKAFLSHQVSIKSSSIYQTDIARVFAKFRV